MHGDVAMEEKTEVKKDDSKEINLRDQVELLKRENCALLMEREKLSAKLGGLTRGGERRVE